MKRLQLKNIAIADSYKLSDDEKKMLLGGANPPCPETAECLCDGKLVIKPFSQGCPITCLYLNAPPPWC